MSFSDVAERAKSRTAEIMADAAHHIVTRNSREFTGQFCIDEDVLRSAGVKDFAQYAAVPGTPDSEMLPDFFLDPPVGAPLRRD